MGKVSGYINTDLFVEMWIGDSNESDLNQLNSPSGSGYHFIKIFPGSTKTINVEVEGNMPQQPTIVSFHGGVHSWKGCINGICNGLPDKASCKINVNGSGTENGIRIQCSSIKIQNSWSNTWQPVIVNRNIECTFDVTVIK